MDEVGSAAIVPCVAVFFIFGMPMLAFIFFRVMAHRERMALIRQGLPPAAGSRLLPTANLSPDDAQTALRKGIRLTCIGISLTLGLSFIGYHGSSAGGYWEPGPWLLGGLVPLFVGIAQMIIAIVSGATFGPQRSVGWGASPYPPAEPAPPPEATASYDASYTYRPGSTQELAPPPSPPTPR